jgi:hypothetical protein
MKPFQRARPNCRMHCSKQGFLPFDQRVAIMSVVHSQKTATFEGACRRNVASVAQRCSSARFSSHADNYSLEVSSRNMCIARRAPRIFISQNKRYILFTRLDSLIKGRRGAREMPTNYEMSLRVGARLVLRRPRTNLIEGL